MIAIKIYKTGGPEVLKIEKINLKKPGSDEVLIEHKAIALNFIDVYHRSGLYPVELPSGIGAEASGIIKEIGSNVKDFKITIESSTKLSDEEVEKLKQDAEKHAEEESTM